MICKCGNEIPQERLEALPGTTTCVNCSTVKSKICLMDYGHKTAPSMVVIDQDDSEQMRLTTRAFKRSR